MSVFQYGAVCSVCTAVSEKKNALACVMLAMVVLSVQVNALCFMLLCVFIHLSNLHRETQTEDSKAHTDTHIQRKSIWLLLHSVFILRDAESGDMMKRWIKRFTVYDKWCSSTPLITCLNVYSCLLDK